MSKDKRIELICKLRQAERIFGEAATLNLAPDTKSQLAPLIKELLRAFEAFCAENGFSAIEVPEQREEIFRELKSLLPELPELICPDCLSQFPAYIFVRSMLASYDALTNVHWEAFFRTLAGIAYCFRSELEARKG